MVVMKCRDVHQQFGLDRMQFLRHAAVLRGALKYMIWVFLEVLSH